MFFFTEDLINSILKRSLVPISAKTFATSDLERFANEEMETFLIDDIRSVREDFFLKSKIVPIVAGLNHYSLPERAIGNELKDLWYTDSGGTIWPLPRLDFREQAYQGNLATAPVGYYFLDSEVVILPMPSTSSGTLTFWYHNRPSTLTDTVNCSKVTAVSSASGLTTFTVDTDLTGSFAAGGTLDVLNAQSPFFNLAQDIVIQTITASTIIFNTSDVSNEAGTVTVGVGDYICPPQKANIPMIPQEFHPLLSALVVKRILHSLGDIQKLQALETELTQMRRNALSLISNRSERGTPIITTRRGIFSYLNWPGPRGVLPK